MASFETIEAQLKLSTDKFTSGIDNAIGGLSSLESKSKSTHKAIGALGVGMAAVAAGGIAKSIDAAAGLDASLTESQAIMGDLTENEMAAMEEKAREIGKTTTFSAEESADAFYYLASAGMDAEQSVSAMGTVAEFATAGAFDLATATDLATDAQSALGLASEDAAENEENLAKVTDTLVKANTLANASVEEFSSSLTNKAAASMRQAGIEIEEGTSALAVFADQGLKGDRAGTILARTIEGLQGAAQDNAEAFEDLGVSVYDADGEMRPMADIVEDLEKGMEGMSQEQKNAAMSQLGLNERAAQGVNLMMGNTDAMREYEDELGNAGGTAGEVADKQLQSFNAQLDLLKSNVLDVGIGIGQVFLPPLTELLKHVSTAVSAFADLNTKMGGMPGAVALVATLFTGLAMAAGSAAAVFGGTGLAATALTGAIGGLAAMLSILLSPIGLVIGAVALLAYAWTQNWGGIQEKTSAVVENILAYLDPVISLLRDEFGQTLDVWRAKAADVLAWFDARWAEHGDEIMAIVRPLWNAVVRLTRGTFDTLIDITVALLRLLRGDWSGAKDALLNIVDRLVSGIVDLFQWLYDKLIGNSIIPEMLGDIRDFFANFDLVEAALSAPRDILDAYIWLAHKLVGRDSLIGGLLRDIASKIKDFSLVDAGKALIDGFIDGIKAKADAALEASKDLLKNIRDLWPFSDAKEGPLTDVSTIGPTFVSMIADGMLSKEGMAASASEDVAQAARPEPTAAVPDVPVAQGAADSGGGGDILFDFSGLDDDDLIRIGALKEMIRGEVEEWDKERSLTLDRRNPGA